MGNNPTENLMLFKEFHIRPATNNDIPSKKKVVFASLEEYALKPEENGKDNDLQDTERNYFSNNGFFGVALNINSNNMVDTFGLFPITENILLDAILSRLTISD